MADKNIAESTNDTRADFDRETLHDYIKQIRNSLHIGLASYGALEGVLNDFKVSKAIGVSIAGVSEPQHPTGGADVVGKFAEALRLLDILEDAPLAV
jgi:hypothetical protein